MAADLVSVDRLDLAAGDVAREHRAVKLRDGYVCVVCQVRWPCLLFQSYALERAHEFSRPPEIRPEPKEAKR
jgi:hypothetical protein